MRKIFTDKIEDCLVLSGEEHKHLSIVLRAKMGDTVIVCCGDGYDYNYGIESFSKNETTLLLQDKTENFCDANIKLSLYTAILKGDKNEYVARTCTELGVTEICPLITKYIQVKSDSYKIERIKKIVLEASKQCGRGSLPIVNYPIDIAALPGKLCDYDLVIFPYEKAKDNDIKTVLASKINEFESRIDDKNDPLKVAIIIGSEGGFAEEEAELLCKANATCVTLGKRILRADTACTAVCAMVMCQLGELK